MERREHWWLVQLRYLTESHQPPAEPLTGLLKCLLSSSQLGISISVEHAGAMNDFVARRVQEVYHAFDCVNERLPSRGGTILSAGNPDGYIYQLINRLTFSCLFVGKRAV